MFTINEYPSERGVYRFDIPMDPAPLASEFSYYWEKIGQPNVMSALQNTPLQVGMFYQPSGFADDGSPLKPTDWETGFLVGDEFEQNFNANPDLAVWFQPGNIVIRKGQKTADSPAYVTMVQFYLILMEDVDLSQLPTSFEPNEFFSQLLKELADKQSDLGLYYGGSLGQFGLLTTVAAKVIAALLFTALIGIVVWYLFYSGRMAVYQKKAIAYGEHLFDKTGKALKEGVKNVIAGEKKKINQMLTDAKNAIGNMLTDAGGKAKELVQQTGVKFTKSIKPFETALWVVVALGAGYGLVKTAMYFKDKDKKKRKTNPLIKRTKQQARKRIHKP